MLIKISFSSPNICFIIRLMTYLVLALVVVFQFYPRIEIDNSDHHMQDIPAISQTEHDNIDDSVTKHSHTHKHSEDGEEHEHSHGHGRIVFADSTSFYSASKFSLKCVEPKKGVNFLENSLISDPHPHGIFRPPIS